ncbi:MAG: efflux RND transporter periplasmic adaptor subunit [Deltaproteobacteria bacterium]|nr:efflux RND transporter periplasmic adaptor subunit [Deltaproteobacteria bacterium]
MRKRIVIIIFLSLLIGVSLLVYYGQKERQLAEQFYSGTIEARQANLSFQVSGRVTDILVDEGQKVAQGQMLAVIDDSEFVARCEQAGENLEASKKALKHLEQALEIQKKTLPVEVERAGAVVDALRSQLRELEAGYQSQDIEKSRLTLLASRAVMEIALKDKNRYDELFEGKIISEKEREAIGLRYETALREYERARENYDQLSKGFREESIQTARARLSEGEAMLKQAKSNLDKIGLSKTEIERARAQVRASEAALNLAETQLGFTKITAPFEGIITSRNVEKGEIVTIGRELFSLSDLSSVDLKIFVDETEIGAVKPGRPVAIKVDTFPDKLFHGKVSFISSEGEFTPKIIQTRKERVKLVYMVKVLIPNPDLELKPGMPADAWLR